MTELLELLGIVLLILLACRLAFPVQTKDPLDHGPRPPWAQ